MEFYDTLLLLSGILFCTFTAHGFPAGAPRPMCITMIPHHSQINMQNTAPPYVIEVSSTTYNPGDVLTVNLKATSNIAFKGFQVRPIQVGGNEEFFFGNFTQYPKNAKAYVWYPPENGIWEMGCVTHTDNKDKKEILIKWKAPSQSVGPVAFKATFLQNYESYWGNVLSKVINPTVPRNLTYPMTISNEVAPFNLESECGVTKGCILYPHGCIVPECQFAIGYHVNQNMKIISFEVIGNIKGYVSIGFSEDIMMGNDPVVTCANDKTSNVIFYGFNPPNVKFSVRAKLNPNRMTNLAITRRNDKLHCTFNTSFTDTVWYFHSSKFENFNLEFWKPAYVFVSYGPMFKNTSEPMPHDVKPLITKSKIDLTKVEIHYPAQIHDYLKAHSSLGITSWLLLAPIGAFIARYFRTELNTMMMCNAMLWFHLHRSTMVLVSIINAIVIIVIFSYLKAWTKHATVHAIVGLVTIGLSYLNVFMAILRPNADSPNRPIFNWMHRIGGTLSFLCAVISLFLGSNNYLLDSNLRRNLTLIITLWFAAITLWLVIMELLSCVKKSKPDENTKGQIQTEETQKNSSFPVKTIVFVTYLLMCTSFYVGLMYVIVMA